MIRRNFLLAFVSFFIFSTSLFSQKFELNTLLIPKELSEDANTIVRFENYNIEMTSQRDMTVTIEKAITIYNKYGNNYANISISYDKTTHVKSVSGYIYDSMGNEIEKIKRKDFEDYSASDGFSLYNDGRYISYNYTPTGYPYTIYYTYVVKTSNTAFIRQWYPIKSYYQSVQKSNYSFTYPLDVTLRKSEVNFEGSEIEIDESQGLLKYTLTNFAAIEREPYDPSFIDIVPNARLGVNKFNLEGVDGEAENWSEFGQWRYHNLNNGNGKINGPIVLKVQKLVENVSDPVEKAKIIYEYVQNKVRYISIQDGIGGWKPMHADEVERTSYGDCKALTNYTKTLLDAVGVESYYTVLWAGREKRDVNKDVFSMQGNHVILNLPTEDGDLWLECTSQNTPFADVGDFTDDRDVLVITPEGGVIKHTRVYDDRENHQNTKGTIIIDNKGHIDAEVRLESSGTQFDNHLRYENSNNIDREKMYKEFWDNINNITLKKIDIKNNKKDGKFEESVTFTAANYGVISGERMIFPVNAFNVWQSAPKRIRDRKLPVNVSRGFYDVDEVVITLPSDYTIEAMSDNVQFTDDYGSYEMTIDKIDENTLKFTRKLLLNSGDYPKEKYTEYRNFWRKVVKSDKSKIVLIKK